MGESIGYLALMDLVRALEAMSTGEGYHFDYSGVLEGYYEWTAEACSNEPKVLVLVEELEQDYGGERAVGGAFTHWMVVRARVHVAAPAGNFGFELAQRMFWVQDDLKKAALTNRHRSNVGGHACTFWEACRWLFPASLPEGALGGTIDAEIRIRWDSSAASDAVTT